MLGLSIITHMQIQTKISLGPFSKPNIIPNFTSYWIKHNRTKKNNWSKNRRENIKNFPASMNIPAFNCRKLENCRPKLPVCRRKSFFLTFETGYFHIHASHDLMNLFEYQTAPSNTINHEKNEI